MGPDQNQPRVSGEYNEWRGYRSGNPGNQPRVSGEYYRNVRLYKGVL